MLINTASSYWEIIGENAERESDFMIMTLETTASISTEPTVGKCFLAWRWNSRRGSSSATHENHFRAHWKTTPSSLNSNNPMSWKLGFIPFSLSLSLHFHLLQNQQIGPDISALCIRIPIPHSEMKYDGLTWRWNPPIWSDSRRWWAAFWPSAPQNGITSSHHHIITSSHHHIITFNSLTELVLQSSCVI